MVAPSSSRLPLMARISSSYSPSFRQQFVFAFLQAFDFDFLVLVVVDALQAAGYSAVFIDYVEFYPVVRGIGFDSLAGVGTVVLVAVAP